MVYQYGDVVSGNSNIESEVIDFAEWNATHFPNFDNYEHIASREHLFWLPSDLNITGSRISQRFETFMLGVSFNPYSSCGMSYEEFLQDVSRVNILLLVGNEIINPHKFDDPVQTIVDDQYTMIVDPKQLTYVDLYLRK